VLHSVPPGFLRLVCPSGAEGALVSHDVHGYEPFRELGPGRGRWLVDTPREAAHYLTRYGGFHLLDPEDLK
jgi:hypothetical protein